jgi:hypothetical protein
MNISVPRDDRKQWPAATIWAANAMMGRWLTDGVETVAPGGAYILKNSWPTLPATNSNFSSSVAASQAVPDVPPKSSSTAARALWPALS